LRKRCKKIVIGELKNTVPAAERVNCAIQQCRTNYFGTNFSFINNIEFVFFEIVTGRF